MAASMPASCFNWACTSSPWSISNNPTCSSLVTCKVCDFLSKENICRIFSNEKPSIFCAVVFIICYSIRNRSGAGTYSSGFRSLCCMPQHCSTDTNTSIRTGSAPWMRPGSHCESSLPDKAFLFLSTHIFRNKIEKIKEKERKDKFYHNWLIKMPCRRKTCSTLPKPVYLQPVAAVFQPG